MKRAQEITPDHFLLHMRMGLLRIQQRRYDEAVHALEKAVDLADRSTETLAALAMAYAAANAAKPARKIIDELENASRTRYVLPYNMAKIYAAAGNTQKTFEWLERAYGEGNPDLIELNSEPIFDGIRGDARFTGLMRRIGWKV